MQDHIDFHMQLESTPWRIDVDVKDRKATRRGDVQRHDPILLEYTNVLGRPGWVRGKAHIIAQRVTSGDDFVLLDRVKLQSHLETVFTRDELDNPDRDGRKGALRRVLGRRDRRDAFAWFSLEEACKEAACGVLVSKETEKRMLSL